MVAAMMATSAVGVEGAAVVVAPGDVCGDNDDRNDVAVSAHGLGLCLKGVGVQPQVVVALALAVENHAGTMERD